MIDQTNDPAVVERYLSIVTPPKKKPTSFVHEDVLDKLEKLPDHAEVTIERRKPIGQGVPWSVVVDDNAVGETFGMGTGNSLIEAIDDALQDVQRSEWSATC